MSTVNTARDVLNEFGETQQGSITSIGVSESPTGRHCQTKRAWDGQGEFVEPANDKTQSIQVLQNKPRDHPPGCDALCSVSALTP